MKIPSRILAALALAGLMFGKSEISVAWGAYDNGLLMLIAPIVGFAVAIILPVLTVATIVIALAIWMLALISNFAVLVVGTSAYLVKIAAKGSLYLFSALIFIGVLLAITNFGGAFVKGPEAGHETVWLLALPFALALIAHLY